ncbi:MAG: hypothetical protein U0V74_04780 [Chitinophagales bacterium]
MADTEIEELAAEIYQSCGIHPTNQTVEPFGPRLSAINIKSFITYTFLSESSSYSQNVLLATFKFWNHLKYADWLEIFEQARGNNLAEYYLFLFAVQYLDIDPHFESTIEVEPAIITLTDGVVHSGRKFIAEATGALRERYYQMLEKHYGLSFNDFVTLSKRLKEERKTT